MNPRPPECKSSFITKLDLFVEFEQWLMKNHSKKYSHDLVKYAERYHYVLRDSAKVSDVMALSPDVKRQVMASLANLSKFLGLYQKWKSLRANSGLKWESKPSLDIVLDILNSPLRDTMDWLKQVLCGLPKPYATVLARAVNSRFLHKWLMQHE